MRRQYFPTNFLFALIATSCISPEEKTCSQGFALASDGNCYEIAEGEDGRGGDYWLNGWRSPVDSDIDNDNFGYCGAAYYTGKDGVPRRHIGADYGTGEGGAETAPVYAIAAGTVLNGDSPSKGGWTCDTGSTTTNVALTVLYESEDGPFIAVYGHLEESSVVGSGAVLAGDVLGRVGDYPCGGNPGDHLHFGIFPGSESDFPASGWGIVSDSDCDSPDETSGFVAPYTYLTTYAPVDAVTHDGYFSSVALDGSSLTVSGKVWAAEGIEKFTVTVGDNTNSSDPKMYTKHYGGSTTQDKFGPERIDLSDTDLETGSHDVGLWVEDTKGVFALVDVGGPVNYTADDGLSGTIDFDPAPSPTVEPGFVTAGDSVTIEFEIDNDGSASTGSYTVAAYLSTDTSWGSGDRELDSWALSSLAAGARGSYTKSVEIPSSTAAATYRVIIFADPDDDVSEVSESDNTAYSSTVTVSASSTTVDLAPAKPIASPRTLAAGDSITLSGDVDNNGTGSSGTFTMAAYLSTNTAWSSTSDILLDSWTGSSISAGGNWNYSTSVIIPSSTLSATYYVIVVADPDDDVSEVSESDNTAYSSTITVSGACTATDYWSPASTADTAEGRTADGTVDGTGNGVDLEIEIRDDGTDDLEFRVCKSGSRFSGADIWVTFDEDESGYGTSLFDEAVSTSSSSYCTAWKSLGVGSSTEGDLIGGDWHVESSSIGMTWGAGCTDDGDTASDCWFFEGHDTLERTCL